LLERVRLDDQHLRAEVEDVLDRVLDDLLGVPPGEVRLDVLDPIRRDAVANDGGVVAVVGVRALAGV
jgi:hypothetical protein